MADEQRSDGPADRDAEPEPERAVEERRSRGEEAAAMGEGQGGELGDLDAVLEAHDYPATTSDLVEAYGDYVLETQGGERSLETILSATEDQVYDSAADVRRRVLGLIGR